MLGYCFDGKNATIQMIRLAAKTKKLLMLIVWEN
jgi:hypothetical protein